MSFEIVLADPPWSYDKKVGQGVADEQYGTMRIEDIKALKVDAAENAVLFLWATFPLLQEALDVIKAWGFEYKTVAFTWVKLNSDGSPFFGIGHYTKSNAEICLLATKGKGLPILSNKVSQIVMSRRREHSRKPDAIYSLIESLYGGGTSRMEMFARHKREGWTAWGNQVPKESQRILREIEAVNHG